MSGVILALIAKQPDLTLEEGIFAAMAKQGIPGSDAIHSS